MVSECTTVAQHHISSNMPGVLLQYHSTMAAGGSNSGPDKPSGTVMTSLPNAADSHASHPEGPTAAAAPMVPGHAIATAVENMPTVGAANFTLPPPPFHTPAGYAEAGSSAGTVSQHDLAVFRQQEEEAAMLAEVKAGSFFKKLKLTPGYKVCAASPASTFVMDCYTFMTPCASYCTWWYCIALSGCIAARAAFFRIWHLSGSVFVRMCIDQDLHLSGSAYGCLHLFLSCTSCCPASGCLLKYTLSSNLGSSSHLPYGLRSTLHSSLNGHSHWG